MSDQQFDDQAENEKVNIALEKVENALAGLSVLHATFIIGTLVAEQSSHQLEAEEICDLILSAALYQLEEAETAANTLPV